MNFLFVNTLYYPNQVGGAERSVRIMAEYLAERGNDVSVLSIHRGDELETRTVEGVHVYYLPSRNLFYPHENGDTPSWADSAPAKAIWHTVNSYDPRMARGVGRVFQVVGPDIVHTNNLTGFSTAVWSVAQRRGLPLVHTLRDYYLLCHRGTMYRDQSNCSPQCWHCKPFAAIRKRMTRLVDAVVGISKFILDTHRKHNCFDKTSVEAVIPNPYDGSSIDPENIRPSIDLPLQVGFLGRLASSKGVEVLLKAAGSTPTGLIDVHVGGTGKEDYINTLKKAHSGTDVTFHGYVDPSKFLPSLDVLVVPSLWREPLGRVVFEAFAYGVPVLGADRGGIPEMIDENATGYVFDPSDPDSLRDLLVKIARTPSHLSSMREEAYEESLQYHPETVMNEYFEVYRRVQSGAEKPT